MNFELEQHGDYDEFEGKENKVIGRKISQSFRSSSSAMQNNKMSEDIRKSAIISFKEGFAKKKSFAGKLMNITCSNEKDGSAVEEEKKSKFCLEF
jgi:hypothetical protein